MAGKKTLATGLLLATAACIYLFQNCSRMKLTTDLVSQGSSAATLELKANYCSDSRTLPPETGKYLFVIDMSMSNIGAWDTDPQSGYVIPPSYFDASKATDFNGNRFSAVEHFLSTCGNQAGAQFAVIGFSNAAGIISGSSSTAALTCTNVQFGSAADTLVHLYELAAAQESEKPWFLQWQRSLGKYVTDPNFPPILSATSYHSALDCAQHVVIEDLNRPTYNPSDNYHVFFMSDGAAADPIGGLCNQTGMTAQQKSDCQTEAVVESASIMRLAAFAKSKDLRIHTLFYGGVTSVPTLMNRISNEGGTTEVLKLDKFESNSNAICSLLANQINIDLRPDSMAAINMTTLRQHEKLVADSDMDGLSDPDEAALGFDPADPRSRVEGVLDGICVRLGGLAKCQAERATVTCDATKFNKAALTDCDVKILHLNLFKSLPHWGVDSDLDGIVDWVEIVKGTDPARGDMIGDPDGDRLINRSEIQRGTDLNTPDDLLPLYKLNDILIQFVAKSPIPTCDYGSWLVQVKRLQSTPTLAVNSWPAPFDFLNHAANEHVVTFFYRLTPSNSVAPTSEFFWSFARVTMDFSADPENPKVISQSIDNILKSDFSSIGEVSQ